MLVEDVLPKVFNQWDLGTLGSLIIQMFLNEGSGSRLIIVLIKSVCVFMQKREKNHLILYYKDTNNTHVYQEYVLNAISPNFLMLSVAKPSC